MGQPFSDIVTAIIKQYISKLSTLSVDVLITLPCALSLNVAGKRIIDQFDCVTLHN